MSVKTELTTPVKVVNKKKNKKVAKEKSENLVGLFFVSPMLIGVTILVLLPIFATFALSFADWSFITPLSQLKWVGLDNFTKLFKMRSF